LAAADLLDLTLLTANLFVLATDLLILSAGTRLSRVTLRTDHRSPERSSGCSDRNTTTGVTRLVPDDSTKACAESTSGEGASGCALMFRAAS
jgi:hypothetical protein